MVKAMNDGNSNAEHVIYVYYLLVLLEPSKNMTHKLAAFLIQKLRNKMMDGEALKAGCFPADEDDLNNKCRSIMVAMETLRKTKLYPITGLVNMHSVFSL